MDNDDNDNTNNEDDISLFLTIIYDTDYEERVIEFTALLVKEDIINFKKLKLYHYDNRPTVFVKEILQKLGETYKLKSIYVFGDHPVLRLLDIPADVPLIDIRESRITGDFILNIDAAYDSSLYTLYKPRVQPHGIKILPSHTESISNLCQLISKNVVRGYVASRGCMRFNISNDRFGCSSCKKLSPVHFNRCSRVLTVQNRLCVMLLRKARSLRYAINDDRKGDELIEFILQCVFLNLSQPQYIRYTSFPLEIFVDHIKVFSADGGSLRPSRVLCYPAANTVEKIRDTVARFNRDVKKLDEIQHAGLMENLTAFVLGTPHPSLSLL